MENNVIIDKIRKLVKERNKLSQEILKIDFAINSMRDLIDEPIKEELDLDFDSPSTLNEVSQGSFPIKKSEDKPEENKKKQYVFDDGYHINMSYNNKVKFVIKQLNRFVHNREIAEELHRREPEMSEDEWSRKVSGALSTLRRREELVNYSVNGINRNTFWGSPKWLDDDGEILEDYIYNEEYLQYGGETIEI